MQFQAQLDLSICELPIRNGLDVYTCLVAPFLEPESTSSVPTDTATMTSPSGGIATTGPTTAAAAAATEAVSASWTYSNAYIYGDVVTPTSSVPSVTSTSAMADQTSSEVSPPSASPTNWFDYGFVAYPSDPVVSQPDLGITGWSTGYIVTADDGTRIGVLSILSFDFPPEDAATFSNTTAAFIQQARAEGVSKIVIDLQQNSGGLSLLAFDTFRQVSLPRWLL